MLRFILAVTLNMTVAILPAAGDLSPHVRQLVPKGVNLDRHEFRDARNELEQLVRQCGEGVVTGTKSHENRCSFRVELDEHFFKSNFEKGGLLEDPEWAYRTGVTFYEPKREELPENFDLREMMTDSQPEIRQQKCGDCWAWATHHGLEIARAVHDQKTYDHSIQTVLSCSKQGSCSGGYMSAVDFLLHGLPLEEEFPYQGRNSRCKFEKSEIERGWEGKVIATPYIGKSLNHSLAFQNSDAKSNQGEKVRLMREAMYQWKSPLVVTVAGYSMSGAGIYDACSAINSGGNHMVAIVGWDTKDGKTIAHVWNSWGKSHGENGVSRIQWECGTGRLNRGLGVSAKIVQYKAPCVAPEAGQTYLHEMLKGNSVTIGAEQKSTSKCEWVPSEGLEDPKACVTKARPSATTEYHLKVQNDCGASSSMTLVHVWDPKENDRSHDEKISIKTPFGNIKAKIPGGI